MLRLRLKPGAGDSSSSSFLQSAHVNRHVLHAFFLPVALAAIYSPVKVAGLFLFAFPSLTDNNLQTCLLSSWPLLLSARHAVSWNGMKEALTRCL